MKQLVTINTSTKAVQVGSSAWTPPVFTFGETLTLAMRFASNVSGATIDRSLDVRALRAAVGNIDARPTGGRTKLQIGSGISTVNNTTAVFDWNVTASQLQTLINNVAAVVAAYGSATVKLAEGSFLIKFGTALVSVPMQLRENALTPVSFGRINGYQINNQWVQELRFTQAPVAFTDAHVRVLPPQPSITRVQAGGTDSGTDTTWNEIQTLHVPPEFLGTYQLRKGFAKTALLSLDDGVDTIQPAMAILGDGFSVTLPVSYNFNVEFINDLAGQAQDLLEIQVANAPEGDLTLNLPFGLESLASLLRDKPSVTLPLDVVADVADDDDVITSVLLFRIEVTIQRPLMWDGLATVPDVDWLRPPSPIDYVPFTTDQVITGTQSYVTTLGDGAATVFTRDHGLATSAITVSISENFDGGRILSDPADYTAVRDNANSITVTPTGGVLAAGAWILVVSAAGPTSVFLAHTHTIAQILLLQDTLDALGARLAILEAILPSTGPAPATTTSTKGLIIELGDLHEILFSGGAATVDQLTKRPPYMLPAVHIADATTALADPLPDPVANTVYTAAARTQIPIGGGIRNAFVEAGGFVASDGRVNYPAINKTGTTSYYPQCFERGLWELPINAQQFCVNRTLDVQFAVAMQLLKATGEAEYILVIEKGAFTEDATPSATGENLKDIEWDLAAPLVSQRITLTSLKITHPFGCRIFRTAGGITANKMQYGVWAGANAAAPVAPDFALRARLTQFDTKDPDTLARGWVSIALLPAPDGPSTPQAIIT